MGIVDEIKLSFRNGTYLTRLIYINIAIWILVRLVFVVYRLSGSEEMVIFSWLALPASLEMFVSRPWTIFTYMFLHFDFLHILFNVLWLYWFGKIFLEYHNQRKLLSLYLIGGVFGGIAYMLAYNLLPVFRPVLDESQLMGASASVIAIVIAIAVYVPNHLIHLMFIGPIRIKWVALVSVILYIINLSGDNAGGNFAHLGGALWGWIYMAQLMSGREMVGGFERATDNFFSFFNRKRKLKVKYKGVTERQMDYEFNHQKKNQLEDVNRILDKISKSGYDSLTLEEREMLFKMGRKRK